MRFVSAKKGGINTKVIKNRKPRPSIDKRGFFKTAATYSPTVTQYHRRDEAYFSVRNGKRWNPRAITT